MKKSTSKRLTLSKETLRGLDKAAGLDRVVGAAPTQIQTCQGCTTNDSLCTN
jgi:hypothetical protein